MHSNNLINKLKRRLICFILIQFHYLFAIFVHESIIFIEQKHLFHFYCVFYKTLL